MRQVNVAGVLLIVLTFWSSAANSEGGPTKSSNTNIEFSPQFNVINESNTAENWVKSDLSLSLGLTDSNRLDVFGESRKIGDYQILSVQQTYKGLPVIGFDSKLVLNQGSQPSALLGNHFNFEGEFPASAKVPMQEAVLSAGGLAEAEYESRLVYWSPVEEHDLVLSYELARTFQIFPFTPYHHEQQKVYVDATTGGVLQRVSLQYRAKNRKVNDFEAACSQLWVRGPLPTFLSDRVEDLARDQYSRHEGSPTLGGNVDSAYDLLGDGYDFIDDALGMDSIDDKGRMLEMFINVRFNEFMAFPLVQGPQCVGDIFNAFWFPTKQALFMTEEGLQFPEIVLHELGHGIVSNGSNLEYIFQSGALNESIADAIGVSFKAWLHVGKNSGGGEPIPREIWQMRGPEGVMRDLADPRSVIDDVAPYPDHMENYLDWPDNRDNGGVHYNSSIINLAFYLLSEGGRHPRKASGPSIEGIGIFNAAKIYSQAAASLMGTRSDFEDARYAFAKAAELLCGEKSLEWQSVHLAMDAVGIARTSGSPTQEELMAPAAPGCRKISEPEEPEVILDPAEEQKSSDNLGGPLEPSGSILNTRMIVLLALAAAGLFIAVAALVGMRPGREAKSQLDFKPEIDSGSRYVPQSNPDSPPPSGETEMDKVFVPVSSQKTYLISADRNQKIPLNRDYLASGEGLVVGRASEMVHIQLMDGSVSRRHLRLRYQGSKITVEDLNSKRGTTLDGVKLRPFVAVEAIDSQLIGIADFTYKLIID